MMALSEEALKQTGFVLCDAAAIPLPAMFVRQEQALSHPSSDQCSGPAESIHEILQQSPFHSDVEWELLFSSQMSLPERKITSNTVLFGKYCPE